MIGHLSLQFDENHPALEGKALFGADYCASLNDLPHSDGSQKEASMTIASIMVGKSTEYTGVAPDAKVCLCTPGTSCRRKDSLIDEVRADELLEAVLTAIFGLVDVLMVLDFGEH